MKVESVMTRKVSTCTPNDKLEHAIRLMWDNDIGCLVVTDSDNRPVGVITDRDIVMAVYTRGCRLQDLPVSVAMSKRLLTCRTGSQLNELERMMCDAQIRRVPVIDDAGRLVGVATLGDLARSATSNAFHVTEIPGLARTLSGVTERRARAAN